MTLGHDQRDIVRHAVLAPHLQDVLHQARLVVETLPGDVAGLERIMFEGDEGQVGEPTVCLDRKSTRLNSSHDQISYAVFCLKKKKKNSNNSNVPLMPMGYMNEYQADCIILRHPRTWHRRQATPPMKDVSEESGLDRTRIDQA